MFFIDSSVKQWTTGTFYKATTGALVNADDSPISFQMFKPESSIENVITEVRLRLCFKSTYQRIAFQMK